MTDTYLLKTHIHHAAVNGSSFCILVLRGALPQSTSPTTTPSRSPTISKARPPWSVVRGGA